MSGLGCELFGYQKYHDLSFSWETKSEYGETWIHLAEKRKHVLLTCCSKGLNLVGHQWVFVFGACSKSSTQGH